MKILLDTNVILDLFLKREPFSHSAKEIFLLVENGLIDGFISASSITTMHYLVEKSLSKKEADKYIDILLQIFNISPIDKQVLKDAVLNNGNDFEDSIIYTSAYYSKIDYIITRDKTGFAKSKVKTIEPNSFMCIITNDPI